MSCGTPPALVTYAALFYIVDIEAVKRGMTGLPRQRPIRLSLALLTFCGLVILAGAFYWGFSWSKDVFGDAASPIALLIAVAAYVGLVANRARFPDLPSDSAKEALSTVPDFHQVARTGLHYLVPVSVLIWCLMVWFGCLLGRHVHGGPRHHAATANRVLPAPG
jgi:TRAP-type uncharacterized transport system fused permease subunit